MKRKHRSPEQIVKLLREVEKLLANGNSVKESCRQLDLSEQTYYNWKRRYGNMSKAEVKRLKELEKENQQLKKLVAELALDKSIMEEFIKGKY